MKNNLLADLTYKLLTSKAAVLGLSASAAVTGLLAYEAGAVREETQQKVGAAIKTSQSANASGAAFPLQGDLDLEGVPMLWGYDLDFPYQGTTMSVIDGRVILEKGGEYNMAVKNGQSVKISEGLEPVARQCDQTCVAARKVVLSCYLEAGCEIGDLQGAIETLSHYPHGQKL